MAERKVLNKYFPPDFDPSLIPRRKGVKNKQQVVRLMAPFSMRCNTCGEYIYKGKKFNARKETVEGEDYYGIKIFRFYIKCTLCSAEITFKTDPKNTDYAAEHGASRNFEPWREEGEKEEIDRLAKLEEEENNPMKALENRTVDSKREMDILDALQDIRARNARNERFASKEHGEGGPRMEVDMVARIRQGEVETEEERKRREEEEEDEKLVRQVFSKVALPGSSTAPVAGPGPSTLAAAAQSSSSPDSEASPSTTPPVASSSTSQSQVRQLTVKRKADGAEPDLHALLPDSAKELISSKVSEFHATKKKKIDTKKSLGIKIGKSKAVKV